MRETQRRLSKIERASEATQHERTTAAEAQAISEWRSAGGPMSFVLGHTQREAEERAEALRGAGLIQPVDKVHLLPWYPEFKQPFTRHLLLEGWDQEKRDRVFAALKGPGRPYPPGWETR